MAIHYFGDIQHITCATKSGKRRSPLSDIAYNSGEKLKDFTTGRTHERPHRDGTTIIASDIVCALPCPYGDSSVSPAQRREQMYNELYRLNKRNAERVYWKTTIALPNEADDETLKSIAQEIAFSFSEELERPIDFSVHKKPGNNHMHIASPERKYKNGWGQKSISYYINKDGSLNYERIYKDADGNDIRIPKTINDEEPIYITDENGHLVCQNQKKDAGGRRKWQIRNFEGLNPEQVKWMHDENDRIQNKYLLEMGKEQIHRNHPETTKFLKETEIKAEHLGRRNCSLKGKSYEKKRKQNEKYEKYAKALNKTFEKIEQEENKIKQLSIEDKESEALLNVIEGRIDITKKSLEEERQKTKVAITEFVEKVLCPEKVYTQHSLFNILHKKNATGRIAKRIREKAKMKWRGYTGWMRRNYIEKTKTKEIAEVYEQYLRDQNEIKPGEENDHREASLVTLEEIENDIYNEIEQEIERKETEKQKETHHTPQDKPVETNPAPNTSNVVVSKEQVTENESRKKYEELSLKRDRLLEKWRNEAIVFYVETHFAEMSKAYKPYYEDGAKARDILDILQRKESFYKENGTNMDDVLVDLKTKYKDELNKLSARWPNPPQKPDKKVLEEKAIKTFGGLRADILKKRITKLLPDFQSKYEEEYKQVAKDAKKVWEEQLAGKTNTENTKTIGKPKPLTSKKGKTKEETLEKE